MNLDNYGTPSCRIFSIYSGVGPPEMVLTDEVVGSDFSARIPGGKCKENELPWACALRENGEETGLWDIPELIYLSTHVGRHYGGNHDTYLYMCLFTGKKPELHSDDQRIWRVRWHPLCEVFASPRTFKSDNNLKIHPKHCTYIETISRNETFRGVMELCQSKEKTQPSRTSRLAVV